MKQFSILCLIGWLLLLGVLGVGAQDVPAPVREAAITDLNTRLPGTGRPVAWNYRVISAYNTALDCPNLTTGQSVGTPIKAYIIEFEYPNAINYLYHVSEDLQYVIPCDNKIPSDVLVTEIAPIAPSIPQNSAQYNYASQTCPPDLRGFTPSRLQIGSFGLAKNGDPVILQPAYGAVEARTIQIPPSNVMFILAGPECTRDDGVVWWQVEWNGQVGWTAESRLGGYYFVDPITAAELRITLPPTPSLTPTATATFTATFTPTATATFTATFTPTATATATATFTPTATATFTASPTPDIVIGENRQMLSFANVAEWEELGRLELSATGLVWLNNRILLASDGLLQSIDPQFLQPTTPILDEPREGAILALNEDFLALGKGELLQTLNIRRRGVPGLIQNLPLEGELLRLVFSSQGQLASLTGGENPQLRLWTVDPSAWQTPDGLLMIIPKQDESAFFAFSPNGEKMALLDADTLYEFDTRTGQTLLAIPAESGCGGVAYLEGELLFADCQNLYQLGEEEALFSLAEGEIRGLTQLGDWLALLSDSGVEIWAEGESLRRLGLSAHSAYLSPDETLLFFWSEAEVFIWGIP